jgi:hypothetical protein
MKTFYEYINEADALNISGDNLGKRLKNHIVGAAQSASMSLVGGEGPDENLVQALSKGAAGVISELQRAWRQRSGVQAAKEEAAKRTITQKGERRDPSLVSKIIDSYTDLPDEFLKYLSEQDRVKIEKDLLQAINNGSVQDHHAKILASSILKKRAEEMLALVSSVRTPNLRLSNLK